ncbi:MAG: HNH endonuclease signature motif containing protein [Phycisphaerae bacterium]|nr:HNH endonuclease signature motif containing protein [Phycisphaerae bacterium]MDD5239962.1 HNH endonuclease signature motif containing protein [Candidatus Nanoarchaeia archaeon]
MNRKEVYSKYGGRCAYCGREIEFKDMQVDHIVPKKAHPLYTRGVEMEGTDNLNPACRRCNHYKRAHNLDFFRHMLETLNKRISGIYICKVAEDYGIIRVEEWDGLFYFERED